MFVLVPPFKIITISHFPSGGLTFSSALGSRSQKRESVAGNVNSWKGWLYARNRLSLLRFLVSRYMNRLQIMVSIDVSIKYFSFWNICNICRTLSARAVGRAWTGNSRTDSPSNQFYASLATRMFPFPWIKTVCLSAFWQSHHCW